MLAHRFRRPRLVTPTAARVPGRPRSARAALAACRVVTPAERVAFVHVYPAGPSALQPGGGGAPGVAATIDGAPRPTCPTRAFEPAPPGCCAGREPETAG